MSIASNFPTISPTLNLSFALTKQLDPRIDFTRASTATYYGTETAKAEENLFLYSQPLNAGWIKIGTSVLTENNATAPDGTSTAALIACPATSDYIYQVPATTIGLAYAFSFFVKNSTATISQYHVRTSGTAALGTLTWSGATLSSVTPTIGTASFVAVGNDWYRVSVFYTATETAARHRIAAGDGSTSTGNIFLWGAQLEQRSAVTAYTPTTTQPITNYIPVLQTAASGVARFDHNPTTFESLALLIEESRTNLVVRSEEFDNAAWSKARASIVANTIVAPDGTLTGDKLVYSTDSGSHNARNTAVAITNPSTITASIFFKQDQNRYVTLAISDGSGVNLSYTIFDLQDELVETNFTAAANVSAPSNQTITPVGNGWYRCSITATVSNVTVAQMWVLGADSAGASIAFVGDGYSGIFIWGAQLEAGAFPTSYIPTVASQVTRAADAGNMTGTNFSSWYNAAEGSLYVEWQKFAPSAFQAVAVASDGTSFNAISINHGSISGSNNSLRFDVIAGAATQASITTITNSPSNTFAKTAAAYAVNDFSAVSNSGAVGTDTLGVLPLVNRLTIGVNGTMAGGFLNGHIRKLAYYPVRCTNAQLQALTS